MRPPLSPLVAFLALLAACSSASGVPTGDGNEAAGQAGTAGQSGAAGTRQGGAAGQGGTPGAGHAGQGGAGGGQAGAGGMSGLSGGGQAGQEASGQGGASGGQAGVSGAAGAQGGQVAAGGQAGTGGVSGGGQAGQDPAGGQGGALSGGGQGGDAGAQGGQDQAGGAGGQGGQDPAGGAGGQDPAGGQGGAAGAAGDAGGMGGSAGGQGGGSGGPAQCPDGSALLYDRTDCSGEGPATPGGLVAAALSSSRGDIVTLGGLAEGTIPCFPVLVCRPVDAPTLIFSDSPEMPSTDGVLYADTLPAGIYRLYVYHANGGAAARKFPAVVLNQGLAEAHVTFARRGLAAQASTDYVGEGKQVALDWLEGSFTKTLAVPAGKRVVLDPELDALHASKDQLVHAIYDLTTDAPLKLSVVSVGAAADAAAVTGGLSLLPRDGHDRGTFPGADALIVATGPVDEHGARHVRLGGATEGTISGIDATTGQPATVLGNYGMLYRVRLTTTGPAALLLAPRGSDWGGAAQAAPGDDGGPAFLALPAGQTTLGSTTEAILLGRYGAGAAPFARLLTAGGSNLPLDLVVAPLP